MVFCQLADCQSLRDIELGMKGIRRELGHLGIRKAPSRNALSRQNRRRNPWVAREVYRRLREKFLWDTCDKNPGRGKCVCRRMWPSVRTVENDSSGTCSFLSQLRLRCLTLQ